jgi:hypothetical protein
MKNRVFVGQPILAAAVFQAAFSRLRASLAEGNRRWFFDPVALRPSESQWQMELLRLN